MIEYHPCPKCECRLQRSGEVGIADQVYPVFQCDECLATVEMFGELIEVALTFAVDAAGRAFDPASHDGSLPISGR